MAKDTAPASTSGRRPHLRPGRVPPQLASALEQPAPLLHPPSTAALRASHLHAVAEATVVPSESRTTRPRAGPLGLRPGRAPPARASISRRRRRRHITHPRPRRARAISTPSPKATAASKGRSRRPRWGKTPGRHHPRGTRGFAGVPSGGDEAGEAGGGGLHAAAARVPRVARGGRRGGRSSMSVVT
jgi:hypothetical protein